MKYNEMKPLIIDWAREKNLTDSGKQYIKVFEEVGELAKAILENDLPEIKDAIGDIAVTLIIHGWQKGKDYDSFIYDVDYQDLEVSNLFKDLVFNISNLDITLMSDLNEIAHKYNTNIDDCLLLAWNTIKDRTGKTVNGTFIKD